MSAVTAQPTLSDLFAKHATKRFLILPDAREVTYGAFRSDAEKMARRLVESGAKKGSRILVQLENSENVLRLYLACAIAGVAACPLDPQMPQQRVAALRTRLEPALFVDKQALAGLLQEPASSTALPEPDPDSDFLIIFSSGTTGEPKGILHTLRSMLESAQSFSALSEMNGNTVIYHHFPMFYMAGIFNLFFCPMVAGSTIVIGSAFSKMQMLRFWEAPMKFGVNHLTLTPTMALSLCQLFRGDSEVLHHLEKYQAIIATGSPLYRSVAERFLDTFKAPLRTCYGVTELGGTITFQSWEDALAMQSMGSPAPGTVIKAGSESAPAEIVVKTPFMARGYLVKGEVVGFRDDEGFFHTGDHGYLKEGLLYFTGREHDLVKKGGEFVSTQLIEDLALRNKHVTDVAAVGAADEYWGARVVLFYVPAKDVTEADVLTEFDRLFEDGLRGIERPDKIIPVPWMPKTSIGKILKRELLQKYTVGEPLAV